MKSVCMKEGRPRILMGLPDHFDVTYAINPWMHDVRVDVALARRQWTCLHRALSQVAEVAVMPAAPGLPDLPFSANAGVVRGDVFVPSRFRHPERQAEEPLFTRWFRENGFQIRALPADVICEGAGDVLVDSERDWAWMGYGPRTDLRAATALASLLEIETVPLRLVDPRFYHFDTCFCPLPGGAVMYLPHALDARSRALVSSRIAPSRRLELTDAEAADFVCNAVVLGERVFMTRTHPRVAAALAAWGLQVEVVEVGEFLKAGGSVRCLTLRLDVPAARSTRLRASA